MEIKPDNNYNKGHLILAWIIIFLGFVGFGFILNLVFGGGLLG